MKKEIKKEIILNYDPELIYLEWCDAVHDNRWLDVKDAKDWIETIDWVVKEAGFLIYEDEESIILAAADKDSQYWAPRRFNGLKKIPKTWIKKRVNLSKYIKKR